MEEGLKCGALAAVVGELPTLPLTASRRLQLAAEAGDVTCFALRRPLRHALPQGEAQPTAAMTRWRIVALPSLLEDEPGIGRPLWHVELLRCRGGTPGRWRLQACDTSGRLQALPEPASAARRIA
jgi:protein ImuA